MQSADAGRENEAMRARIATLNAAILRINTSLDLDTVLHEVMDSARRLTGARYGVIATVDEAGAPRDLVFSGFTPEEQRELYTWPDHARLFEHFRSLPGPLRLADLSGYVHALGIEPARTFSRTFQGTPIRHRGADVGSFFLAEKADGEAFTDDDEEVLTLFASQAAAAIVNARTHRAERRARADLEALVETSPVGVVVFDAESGRPVWFSREARRMVESLRLPGRPPEQLLEVVSFRRGDGREVSLSEFPIAQHLNTGETVRAEEVVLSVPDGRSVRVLVNATPIRTEGGAIGSVVVTMQDLAPLEEIERQRTEFLGLVGHELRQPLAAIKGSATTLLEDGAALDPAEMREFHRIIVEQADHLRGLISDLLDAGRIDSGTLSVAPEPSEMAELVERARNTFLGGDGRHGIVVDLPAGLPRTMADRRRIVQVLNNLFANAARHAPESSSIRVSAVRERTPMSRSRSPTRAAGWRRSVSRNCSTSSPAPGRGPGPATAWDLPFARGWWRRTAGASGPRVPVPGTAPPSPSRFRWPGCRAPKRSRDHRRRPGRRASGRASWSSSTTRGCCASCATRWPRPAMPRW